MAGERQSWSIVEVYPNKRNAESARRQFIKRMPKGIPTMVRRIRIAVGFGKKWRWALYRGA